MSIVPPIVNDFDERKPYIFISYAHADAKKVYPVISRLQRDGFYIWYDNGLEPGSEWAGMIAERLKKSTFFLAFLSRNYFKSDNCLDELNKARDYKRKDITKCLLVYIEEAEMDDGNALRFSRVQAIEWYKYLSDDARCYKKLYETPELARCNRNRRVPQIVIAAPDIPPAGDGKGQKNRGHWLKEKGRKTAAGSSAGRRPIKILALAAVAAAGVVLLKTPVMRLVIPALQQAESSMESESSMEADKENSGGGYNMEDAGDSVKLISIEEPVEENGFQIMEDVKNTMGTTYAKAVVLRSGGIAEEDTYVRYNVKDFDRLTAVYSVDADWSISGEEFSLSIYLDDNEDEPYVRLKCSRSTVETPIDIDVSGAQLITFAIDGDSSRGSLILAEGYLSRGEAGADRPGDTASGEQEEKDRIPLISVETPVEESGFRIAEDVTNTMGTTYYKAVVVSGVDDAYVRYNVGDFNHLIGTYSIENEWTSWQGLDGTLWIYLDDREDEPWAELPISRSTPETPFDIDVSDAQFVTFKMEGYHCALILSDAYLTEEASPALPEGEGTGDSAADGHDKKKLTSIDSPVEKEGFAIAEDVTNTMGTTYDEAVVVQGVDDALLRYNVKDYNRFTAVYSISEWSDWMYEGHSLLIYLDDKEEEPYASLELNRSTPETPLDIDVSGAQFITFKMEGYHCSLILADGYLEK